MVYKTLQRKLKIEQHEPHQDRSLGEIIRFRWQSRLRETIGLVNTIQVQDTYKQP